MKRWLAGWLASLLLRYAIPYAIGNVRRVGLVSPDSTHPPTIVRDLTKTNKRNNTATKPWPPSRLKTLALLLSSSSQGKRWQGR